VPMTVETIPIIGVELGSRLETTTRSVTKRTYVPAGESFTAFRYGPTRQRQVLEAHEKVLVEYRVRHLERHNPLVRYQKVAERAVELVKSVGDAVLVVDLTRMGRPVYALVRQALLGGLEDTRITVNPCPLTVSGIAGGVSRSPDAGWLVPRRDLVSPALVLFEMERLKIAESLELAKTLTEEFVDFKVKPDPKNDLKGWRENKNDDLVLAVSMSVWAAERFLAKRESRPVELPLPG
jgi:hypothetical protein